jgi:hypothetical protein
LTRHLIFTTEKLVDINNYDRVVDPPIDRVVDPPIDRLINPVIDHVDDISLQFNDKNNLDSLSDLDTNISHSNTLEEVSIDLENNVEDDNVLELKSKEFYYDIYRMALEKAKKAKRQALESFLEAKKIKETYMLDEIENDSLDEENLEDSDFEEEYEELY